MVTVLPIVGRELRVASRRKMTYWSRFGAALIAFGAFIWIWITFGRHESSATRGMVLFSVISGATFIFALVAGAATTADCISEEKREGTLGLLFLTDLRGYDVVFGKLVATSLDSLYRLVAVFPVLAVPVMMGGVAPHEVGRVVLVLLNTLFLSLSAGIFFSSISRDDKRARGLTIGFLLLLTAGVPAACGIHAAYHNLRGPVMEFLIPSPGFAFFTSFDRMYRPFHYWGSLAFAHVLAWVGLILACFIVPRTWQDKAKTAKAERLRDFWKRCCYGAGAQRKKFRDSLLDINAVYWLAARDRLKPATVWLTLGLVACFWFALFVRWPNDMLEVGIYITTTLIVNTVLKAWIASEAPRLFANDKRSGALELLLSTPMSVKSILHGQLLGLWKHFGWQLVVVLGFEIVMMTAGLIEEDFEQDLVLIWFVGLTMLIADVIALAWLGMWQGLRAKTANAAGGQVLSRILVLPWFIFFSFLTFAEVSDFPGLRNLDSEHAIIIWLLIGLAVDAWWIYSSRRKLHTQFREIAMQRFQKGLGWRWFGWFRGAPQQPHQPL